jgi:putative Mn2+ efflux pump MntP
MNATLKLIAVILPLGLDTFGVAVALGVAGLPARSRTRVALLFAAFETGMPLLGAALGAPLGRTVGGAADYVAAGLLLALGAYMLGDRDPDGDGDGDGNGDAGERRRLLSMISGGIVPALALGVSISLDELAIGFSAGLLRLPLLELVVAVGIQAFVVTQLGVRVGARVGSRWAEAAEGIAGAALLALGAVLLIERVAG